VNRRVFGALALAACLPAAPAVAQGVSIRPYLLVSSENFAAADTFNAVFGSSRGTFLGGGGQVTFGRFFVDIGASRFTASGERAFVFNGAVFQLGIPLTAKLTPVEFSGGYRARLASVPWLVPYGGAGFGRYHYEESSDFDAPGESVDARSNGFLVYGGAEFRLQRWIGVSVDARYRTIKDILGAGGISQDFGEDDLGGVAARLRVIVGR
jgi:hypothetical protein